MNTTEIPFEVAPPVGGRDQEGSLERSIWASTDWADLDRALTAVAAASRAGNLASERAEQLALWAAAVARNLPETSASNEAARIWADELLPVTEPAITESPDGRALLPAARGEGPARRGCHRALDQSEERRVAA